jgi:integrase
VYLPAELQTVLDRFIRMKKRWGEDVPDDAPLFVSKKGNRLSLRAFNDLMDKWCECAGIGRYTPHALRHTKARRIMDDVRHLNEDDREKALLFVNKQLRHKSMSATLIYAQPTKEQMKTTGAI